MPYPEDNQKNIILAVLVVLVILLVLNSDICRRLFGEGRCGCGCGGSPGKCERLSAAVKNQAASGASQAVKEAFSTRPYRYNQDTAGRGVSWQDDQLDSDQNMSHDDYIRSVGIDKSTVANHRQWYQDPNIKPYYGSNFNLRSDAEQTYLVTPIGLRRRPTAVPIGVSSRQVPDIDERDYAQNNQLGSLGNFEGQTAD